MPSRELSKVKEVKDVKDTRSDSDSVKGRLSNSCHEQ